MSFGIKRITFSAITLTLGIVSAGCEFIQSRSGEELFDAIVWLHFTTDAETYEQIQSQYSWEPGTGDGKENMPGPVAQWWQPEQLKNVSQYQVYTEDCRCTKELWINGSHGEVFFKVSF